MGWSLGTNDAANAFGTAVATRVVKYRTAIIIIAVMVLLGSILQGADDIGKLSSISTNNEVSASVEDLDLVPEIRYSRGDALSKDTGCADCIKEYVLKNGSCATGSCEPCQVGNQAALSGLSRVPRGSLFGVEVAVTVCRGIFEVWVYGSFRRIEYEKSAYA